MQPAIYGPYPYRPITQRKKFSWPDGNRLALWVIPNIEFFHLNDAMPGVNNERVPSAQVKIPNVRNWAIRDYGNRVGIWRFFEVMSRYGIRGTAALNSDICEYHPQIMETGVKLGSYATLLGDSKWSGHAWLGLVLCSAGIIGLWGIGNFHPIITRSIIGEHLKSANLSAGDMVRAKAFWRRGSGSIRRAITDSPRGGAVLACAAIV